MSNLVRSMLENSIAALEEEPKMDIDLANATAAVAGGTGEVRSSDPVEPGLDVQRLTRAFVHMRDARLALKGEFETKDRAIKAKQAIIEAAMLKFLNDHGLDSAPTEAGTFYKQEELTPTGADWDKFYKWIAENDAFDALERRIKKTFVKDYMDEHQGSVPPGVSVFREYVVRVRRK